MEFKIKLTKEQHDQLIEWFGDDEMFGAKGSYAKADRLFSFSEGSGYELTLYRVPNGNLHTSRMKKEDF